MIKQRLIRILRRLALIPLGESVRRHFLTARNRPDNSAFRREHPGFAIPPDELLYETSGDVNYRLYRSYGRAIAEYYLQLVRGYCLAEAAKPLRIFEWGCGPGRIVRHLPELASDEAIRFYASDYDSDAVSWCSAHIPGVEFSHNELSPPLGIPDQFLDALYSVSVFTHLSEAQHHAWISELGRVLKPGGILLITLHGDQYCGKLLADELARYQRGELVVRSQVVEGSRLFAAFHPTDFVRSLLNDFEILAHIENPLPPYILQDQWIARKKM